MNLDDFDKIPCSEIEYFQTNEPCMRIDMGAKGDDAVQYFKLVQKKPKEWGEGIAIAKKAHEDFIRNRDRHIEGFVSYLNTCKPKPDRFAEIDELLDRLYDPRVLDLSAQKQISKQIARAIVELIEKEKA